MKKAYRVRKRLLTGAIALVLGLGIFGWAFTQSKMVSHAESQAKVTAPKGANIRKEASASSAAVGGAENGKVLTVISQVQGGDGNTWYQVKSGDITGYIRSDLVEISEGSTPPEGGEGGNQEGGAAAPPDVTAVNPVNATVSGESGKIRDSASSEGQIIAEVAAQTMLTVTGQATDADGRTWYQVNCLSGETQIEGFIRYDYVTLAEELTPLTEEPAVPEEPEPTAVPEPEPKLYETMLQDGAWLLVDNTGAEPKGYAIDKLFEGVKNNGELVEKSEKTIKNQKVIIIILVFLLVAAAAGIAFLVFKIRDMMDSAYFNEVEKETIRKKKTPSSTQRPGRSGGQERPAGARPAGHGQRPAGASQGQRSSGYGQGERTGNQGQRPAGTSQGARLTGAPQGQRPVRTMQEPRPAGAEGPRTMGVGPGSAGNARGQAGAQQGTRRPAGAVQGTGRAADSAQRGGPAQNPRPARSAQANPQKAQPRNFMAEDEDDDFAHEFLNYDE